MAAKGHLLYRDVFSHYGPVSTYLNASIVALFGDYLLALRIGSVVILALFQGLIFDVNRRLFGPTVAYLSIPVSISITYFFRPQLQHLAWHGDVLLLAVVGTALCLANCASAHSVAQRLLWPAGVGIFMAVALMTRLSTGVILAGVVLFLSARGNRRQTLGTFIPFALVLAGYLLFLMFTGSFEDFLEQTVVGPMSWANEERGFFGLSGLSRNALVIGLPTVCLLGLASLCRLRSPQREPEGSSCTTSPVLLGGLGAIWFAVVVLSSDEKLFSLERLALSSDHIMWASLLVSLAYLAASVLDVSEFHPLTPAAASLACSSVTVIPIFDSRHLYWAVVPTVGIFVATIRWFSSSHRRWLAVVGVLGVCLSVAAARDWATTLNGKAPEVRDAAVLSGMTGSRYFSDFIQPRLSQLSPLLEQHPDTAVFNICSDGLFASIGAVTDLPDPYFVSWDLDVDLFGLDSVTARRRSDFVLSARPAVWMCPLTENPEILAGRYQLELLPVPGEVPTGEEFMWWPYVSYVGVPQEWCAEGQCGQQGISVDQVRSG